MEQIDTKRSPARPRYHLLDELRGFAVVCMVFYHGFFLLAQVFGLSLGDRLLRFFMPAEPFFAGFFILLSGVASELTRSNLRRGLRLSAVALGLTAATWFLTLFGLELTIWFGILHLLAVSMLAVAAVNRWIRKIPAPAGLAACVLLFFCTNHIGDGYLGFSFFKWDLPAGLYDLPWLFPLGICRSDFFSADYFPVFPWIFVFFAGAFLGTYALKDRFPLFFQKKFCPPLDVAGRHALLIYVLHQPVLFGLFSLIQLILP